MPLHGAEGLSATAPPMPKKYCTLLLDDYVGVAMAATYLGVDRRYVYRYIHKQQLAAVWQASLQVWCICRYALMDFKKNRTGKKRVELGKWNGKRPSKSRKAKIAASEKAKEARLEKQELMAKYTKYGSIRKRATVSKRSRESARSVWAEVKAYRAQGLSLEDAYAKRRERIRIEREEAYVQSAMRRKTGRTGLPYAVPVEEYGQEN